MHWAVLILNGHKRELPLDADPGGFAPSLPYRARDDDPRETPSVSTPSGESTFPPVISELLRDAAGKPAGRVVEASAQSSQQRVTSESVCQRLCRRGPLL